MTPLRLRACTSPRTSYFLFRSLAATLIMILKALAAAAALSTCVLGQSSSTSSAVPHGTPIPGDYSGPLRPQVHYSPPVDFMNDPNGLFRDDNGTWHLYYQCKYAQPTEAHILTFFQTTQLAL